MELLNMEITESVDTYTKSQETFLSETLTSGLCVVSFRPVNGCIVSIDFDSAGPNKRLGQPDLETFTGYSYMTTSKNGNSHIYLALREPKDLGIRSAYAAYYGSDPIREALSTRRFYKGEEMPFNMVETPEEIDGLETFLKQATRWHEYIIRRPEVE